MNKYAQPSRFTKSKGKANVSRSKSAPSALKSAHIKQSGSKTLTRIPCYEIEEPCEFYLVEIQKRRFITASIKKSLIDQIKLLKNVGSKIIQTKTKDKSISKQFWTIWNGFQSTLIQEFHHQITSTKYSLKKFINNLCDYIKFIGNESTQEEVIKLTNQTIEELEQDSDENINIILSDFKDLQSYISTGEVNSKKNGANFQLTSLLSPILTQLQNLKDIKTASDKLFSHIDEDTQTFQSLIHNDNNSTPSKNEPHKSLLNKKSQPVFRTANRDIINKQNDESSSNTGTTSSEQVTPELASAQEENAKLKKQIEEMQKKKSDKRIELENKRKDEINEIRNLKSTVSTLKQQSKQLSAQNTKSSTMHVPLSPLRSEIRELELEQVKLDAANSFLLEQIESNSKSKSLSSSLSSYQKNSQLMKKRSELNKELFELKVKCIQINKVIQKATAKTYETNGNDQEIQKEFYKAQRANEEMRSKLAKAVDDFNNQKIQHEETLANKVKSELQEERLDQNQDGDDDYSSDSAENANDQRSSEKSVNLLQQLNNVKNLYRSKKQNLIEEEQKKQIKTARLLRKKTENDLTLLRTNSKSDFDDMMAQAQEVSKQYVNFTDQYNEAYSNKKEKVKYNGQTLTYEDAQKEIQKLINKFTSLTIRINISNAEEANKENTIMKTEIDEIANGNNKLIGNIADVKNKSIEMHSKLQSLLLQHQIFGMKNKDNQYDIKNAFDEAINNTNQQNSVLQEMLDTSLAELNELDIEPPF